MFFNEPRLEPLNEAAGEASGKIDWKELVARHAEDPALVNEPPVVNISVTHDDQTTDYAMSYGGHLWLAPGGEIKVIESRKLTDEQVLLLIAAINKL